MFKLWFTLLTSQCVSYFFENLAHHMRIPRQCEQLVGLKTGCAYWHLWFCFMFAFPPVSTSRVWISGCVRGLQHTPLLWNIQFGNGKEIALVNSSRRTHEIWVGDKVQSSWYGIRLQVLMGQKCRRAPSPVMNEWIKRKRISFHQSALRPGTFSLPHICHNFNLCHRRPPLPLATLGQGKGTQHSVARVIASIVRKNLKVFKGKLPARQPNSRRDGLLGYVPEREAHTRADRIRERRGESPRGRFPEGPNSPP